MNLYHVVKHAGLPGEYVIFDEHKEPMAEDVEVLFDDETIIRAYVNERLAGGYSVVRAF